MKNHQFLQKSAVFTKIWKIINFCKNLKIFNLVRSLKKFCFSKIWKIINFYKKSYFSSILPKFENSSVLQNFDQILKNLHFLHKIWKVFNFDWILQKSSNLTKILLKLKMFYFDLVWKRHHFFNFVQIFKNLLYLPKFENSLISIFHISQRWGRESSTWFT